MAISGDIYLQQRAPDIAGGIERGLKMSDMLQQRQMQRDELGRQKKVQEILGAGTVVSPEGQVSINPQTLSQLSGIATPQEIIQLSGQIQEQQKLEMDAMKNTVSQGAQILSAVRGKPELWGAARSQLLKLKGVTENDIPATYDEKQIDFLVNKAMSIQDQFNQQMKSQEMALKQKELGLKAEELNIKRSEKKTDGSKVATELRKERSSLPTTKDTNTVATAYNTIKSIANDATGASDMSLIFSYMKMLDPTSTVREGEYASARNTAGVPEQIMNAYNKAIDGQFLSPQQRNDFVKQAKKKYDVQLAAQKKVDKKFEQLAIKAGADPKDVIFDVEETEQIEALPDSEIERLYREMGGG